jgi:hypothetical protein
VSRQQLGFHGTELLERFNPDWHHIFPRAHLRNEGVVESAWDVFANIAVMSPSTNIRFGAKNPMAYLDRYNVDDTLLEEQLVDRQLLRVDHYQDFLRQRAEALAGAANRYFDGLRTRPHREPPIPARRQAPPPAPASALRPARAGSTAFLDRWSEKFGVEAVAACQRVTEAIVAAAIPRVQVKHSSHGRPMVYVQGERVARVKLLQAVQSRASFRDTLKGGTRAARDKTVVDAFAQFRQRLLTVPGATAIRSGRVYVPASVVATDPEPLIDAIRWFADTIRP